MVELENLIDEYKDSKSIKFNRQRCYKKKFSTLELIFIILLACMLIYISQIMHEKLFEKKQINLGNLLNFSK